MESIIKWLQMAILRALPEWDLTPLSGKERGKLRLSPEQLIQVIHAQELAEWALQMATWFGRPRLEKGRVGAPLRYGERSILRMAVVQVVWRKSYERIVDYVSSHAELARQMGFSGRTISKGRYWERRQALGILPFLFFFLGLVGQIVRLGVVSGFVLLTYIAAVAVALVAHRYQRPDLYRRRSMVLAQL